MVYHRLIVACGGAVASTYVVACVAAYVAVCIAVFDLYIFRRFLYHSRPHHYNHVVTLRPERKFRLTQQHPVVEEEPVG